MVLSYDTRDPLILSCVLSNVSTLFPFATHQPQLLPQVLSKVSSSNMWLSALIVLVQFLLDFFAESSKSYGLVLQLFAAITFEVVEENKVR